MTENKCALCPRGCITDRENSVGFCGEKNTLRIARAALHFWEEPCISGKSGSGTVFFSGCGLRCVYCQNKKISTGEAGKEISVQRLCDIFFELRDKGANNINLVTPTHFMPGIKEAIILAKQKGFSLPFVYNTSGYETAEALSVIDEYIDIYLTDFKYFSPELAKKYSLAENYPEEAKKALEFMVKSKGVPQYFENGIMRRGVIVRHLVLPGCVHDSEKVIAYVNEKYKDKVILSIMSQYTPPADIKGFPELERRLTRYEYEKVVSFAVSLGIEKAFIQEGSAAKESFIPEFDYTGV